MCVERVAVYALKVSAFRRKVPEGEKAQGSLASLWTIQANLVSVLKKSLGAWQYCWSMSWKGFVNTCNLTTKPGGGICYQTEHLLCQRKEKWSEWAWLTVLHTHGTGAGGAVLDLRLHPAHLLCRKKVKTFIKVCFFVVCILMWGFFLSKCACFFAG